MFVLYPVHCNIMKLLLSPVLPGSSYFALSRRHSVCTVGDFPKGQQISNAGAANFTCFRWDVTECVDYIEGEIGFRMTSKILTCEAPDD